MKYKSHCHFHRHFHQNFLNPFHESSFFSSLASKETEVSVPWTAMMHVSGWEAVWLEEKCNDHWLWFLPVKQLAPYNHRLIAESSGLRFG